MCALSKFIIGKRRKKKVLTYLQKVGMAGSSEYFLNSSGYVYGYIALKAVLAFEYFVG